MDLSASRPRSACLGVLLTALFLALVAAAPASAETAPRVPAQGVYDWCSPAESSDHCASRLRLIAEAGFEVVQNMSGLDGKLSDVRAFADAAEANGVSVIWSLQHGAEPTNFLGSEVTAGCGCTTGEEALTYLIGALRSYPSTWGYYVADEPTPADHDKVVDYAARLKALDPQHPRLVMGCGCRGGDVSFLADVDAALAMTVYPVFDQPPDQPVVADQVAGAAANLRGVADGSGQETVIALQAWRWGDSYWDSGGSWDTTAATRFPTRREIEMQRNAAITHARPKLILWFVLTQVIGWEPGQRPSYWAQPPDPTERWASLVGGAFAPAPAQKAPVARFKVRKRGDRGGRRVIVDARRSYDPDGRIVRYRWYARGGRPFCGRQRCKLTLRDRHQRIKLVVTDDAGARATRVRSI